MIMQYQTLTRSSNLNGRNLYQPLPLRKHLGTVSPISILTREGRPVKLMGNAGTGFHINYLRSMYCTYLFLVLAFWRMDITL